MKNPIVSVDYASTTSLGLVNNGYTLSQPIATIDLVVDGMSPSVGELILVKNETDSINNGVYEVVRLNDPDLDQGYLLNRAFMDIERIYLVFVKSGTDNAQTLWCNNVGLGLYTPGVTSQLFVQVPLSGASGITECTVGNSSSATYPSLLEAFQDGCNLVRVIDTFTDSNSIAAGDVPSTAMVYLDPGIVYTFDGTFDISGKNLLIRGTGTIELTTQFTSDASTELYLFNSTLQLSTSFDNNILTPPYNILKFHNARMIALNVAPSIPLLVPPEDPGVLVINSTRIMGNSGSLQIISDLTSTTPNCEITDLCINGTFATSLTSGSACFELTSLRTHIVGIYVKSVCSFLLAGTISSISSTSTALPLQIVTSGSTLSNCRPLAMGTHAVDDCNINVIINQAVLTISGNANRFTNFDSTSNITVSGDGNALDTISAATITFSGDENTADNISMQGSSSDLNVGGSRNIINNAQVDDRTTINGTNCNVSGLVSVDQITISNTNKLTNFDALDDINISSFPAPTVSNGRIVGTALVSASRASVTDLICGTLSVTGLENSLACINVQSGGSMSVSGIRNSVSGGASASGVTISGDQCTVDGFYFFTSVTLSSDFCSLSSSKCGNGLLTVSGDNNSLSALNISSGLTISGSNNSASGLNMNSGGALTITGAGTHISGSVLRGTTVDVATATNCLFGSNTFSSLTINNGGGGAATDPLLVGNRLPAIPASIAPASTGNQT